MKLTKEIVDMLLAANVKNRSVSPHRVNAIARAMLAGDFIENNGQTIVVNKSWTWLLDGQHRLLAMRKADRYFNVPLVEVADEDARRTFDTIDTVRGARTIGQILTLDGEIPSGVKVTGVLNTLLNRYGFLNPSVSEIRRMYARYSEYIEKLQINKHVVMLNAKANASTIAGALNAVIISDDKDAVIGRYHNVLDANYSAFNSAKSLGRAIMMSKGVGGVINQIELFYKITKGLVLPHLNLVKVEEAEYESFRSKSFKDGICGFKLSI